MSKYTEVLTLKENICKNCCTWDKSLRNCDTCDVSVELESLEIADRLEQAEGELKYEYALINDWFMNKYDINVEHTELETDALHFTGMIMQTIGYLLDALADIRGDTE